MRKEIRICDFCGKESRKIFLYHRLELATAVNRNIDICPECEKLFITLADATSETKERVAEILKGETDEEG